MRSAFALRIISGNIIYNRAMPERLRTLRHCIFTGWVWNELPQSSLRDASSLWEGAFGMAVQFLAQVQSCGHARSPLGELSRSD